MGRTNGLPCTIMRGGTSKGIFLRERDLPADPAVRERVILAVFGSPDIRQIDGLGGADSLTSKLAIIAPSERPDCDIDYTFGAVGIDSPFVDYSANCGNISSAVGPYAIDKRLVKAEEPFTIVRIYNTNTNKRIEAKVPVNRGRVVVEGDYRIDGCPGSGARIDLGFIDPAGAVTGRLLPTGNTVDSLRLENGKTCPVTIVDAGNPTAFVDAEELNLTGEELPEALDRDHATLMKLEALRRRVGEQIGMAVTPSIPKISFVAAARSYQTVTGHTVSRQEVHLLARLMAMGKIHKAFAITAAIPAAIAAVLPGSVVHRVAAAGGPLPPGSAIWIGHPSGVIDLRVDARFDGDQPRIVRCTVGRTARKILDGRVYVSDTIQKTKGVTGSR